MNTENKYVPIAIIIVGLLIAGAIYWRPAAPAPVTDSTNSQAAQLAQAKAALTKMVPVSASEHVKGQIAAPVTIIEYSDLECPFCKAFQWATNDLVAKYGTGNKVAWVFRQFPLNIHSKAPTEAAAAECANKLGGNDKFWQYIDKIYEITPANNGLDLALLPKTAKDLGIDETKFNACLTSADAKALVDKQIKDGENIKVDGTPFVIVINDKGEKILPFYEQAPTTWSAEAKQIVSDLLTNYQASIQKLRNQ